MRTYTYIAICGIMAILMQQRGKMRTTKPYRKKNVRPTERFQKQHRKKRKLLN